jgi:molybdopterin/thiamine biosynthesis adenylyltransferase
VNKIKIIGCGGIASWLLPPLCHYLNHSVKEGVEISLIDGDEFEERNRERQVFTKRGNKAEIKAEELRAAYPRLFFWPHATYITEKNAVMLLREKDCVFLCVDNHKTRKLVSDRSLELDNVTIISGGNELTDGNIQVFRRRDGKNVGLPIANEYHQEIVNPRDRNPADVEEERRGCQQLVEASPQLVVTNNAIASLMFNCYYGVLVGKLDYDEVYTDVVKNKSRAVKRSN